MEDREAYEAGEAFIKQDLVIASRIYVDLAFVKYLDLGKLLSCKNMTAAIYRSVVKFLESGEFGLRYTDCPMVVFKNIREMKYFFDGCKISNRSDDQTVLQSPPFSSERDVAAFVNTIKQNKLILEVDTPITIDVNIWQVPNLSQPVINCLCHVYSEMFGAEVKIINTPFDKMSVGEVSKYDAFFIYSLETFNNVFIEELDARKFFDKIIFTRRIIPEAMLEDLTGVNISEFFTTIFGVMSLACKFEFVRNPTCIISP